MVYYLLGLLFTALISIQNLKEVRAVVSFRYSDWLVILLFMVFWPLALPVLIVTTKVFTKERSWFWGRK